MLPLNLSFRKMIRKYIPQITSEDLNNYENLIALRHQVFQEINIVGDMNSSTPPGESGKENENDQQINNNSGNNEENEPTQLDRKELTKEITEKANDIIKKYKKPFEAALQLWIARKQFAQEQGYFSQIPNSVQGFKRFIRTAINYRNVQRKTLPILWKNRTIYFFQNLSMSKVIAIAIVVVLVVIGFQAVNIKDKIPGEEPGHPGNLLQPDSTSFVQPAQDDTTLNIQ